MHKQRLLCKMLEYRCLVLRIITQSSRKLPGSKVPLCRHFIYGETPKSERVKPLWSDSLHWTLVKWKFTTPCKQKYIPLEGLHQPQDLQAIIKLSADDSQSCSEAAWIKRNLWIKSHACGCYSLMHILAKGMTHWSQPRGALTLSRL